MSVITSEHSQAGRPYIANKILELIENESSKGYAPLFTRWIKSYEKIATVKKWAKLKQTFRQVQSLTNIDSLVENISWRRVTII